LLKQKTQAMAAIAGIKTTKNSNGQLTHITIDLRKHKKAIPVLNEIGLLEKTKFQKERENGLTVEEFRQAMHEKIKQWSK
jgi:hypothetical protein